MPPEVLSAFSEDSEREPDILPKTFVAVEVLDTKSGALHVWSLSELR